MGGGRQMLQSHAKAMEFDPIDTWACYSRDGRDLIREWTADKTSKKSTYSVLQNNEQLRNLDADSVDYVLGIFANGHISMDWERNTGPKGQPSLEEMTIAALRVLNKSKSGYLLVVIYMSTFNCC